MIILNMIRSDFMQTKNGYINLDEKEKTSVFSFCEGYKDFLNSARTERECVKEAVKIATDNGFVPFESLKELKSGDKVYAINKNKEMILAVIGSDNILDGIKIVGAHIDCPRLDLKPNPLFEEADTALLKTHYYGGIKKYQWVTTPLALHGVVIKKDGSKEEIKIGDADDDITFVITDILPHLDKEQMKKNANEIVEGEALNVLFGSIPLNDKEKDCVKENILKLLNEKYKITEDDFSCAEIEVVPSYKAKDAGLDRSLIASYGHDDRVCAYTALSAILDTKECKKTSMCILTDKEEVGSMGNTGAKSYFMRLFILEMMEKCGVEATQLNFLRCLDKSMCLSADVNAAYDTNYSSVFEKNNSSIINRGIAISKYGGARGKSGSNDASAEMMGFLRELFDANGVLWQMGELGKVDAGGGGTISQYIANLGPETIDCGVAVLSMHSPYEIVSKLDVYMTYKAFKVFFK